MRILALDLGTRCGWAMRHDADRIDSGVWNLQPRRQDGPGMRWVRFRAHLSDLLAAAKPEMVAFEEVRRHLGTDAAHVFGGLKAVLEEECERAKIPYTSIPVATIKREATGKGNADKDAMVAAARARWPGFEPATDDEADARFLALAAARELEPTKKGTP